MRYLTLLSLLALTGCGNTKFSGQQKAETKAPAAAADATPSATSIALTPLNPTLGIGQTQQFTATATGVDGTTKDITKTATWTAKDTSTAQFKDAASAGLLTAVASGNTEIAVTDGTNTATTMVVITAATLMSLAITPAPLNVDLGTPKQATATGTYSDGSTKDLTSQAAWGVADAKIATVGNAATAGLVNPVAIGATNLTATFNGMAATVPLTVASPLRCTSTAAIVGAGASTHLTWSRSADAAYSIKAMAATTATDLGTVAADANGLGATYTAPAHVPAAVDVLVTATPKNAADAPAACEIRLSADGGLGVADDGKTSGLVGNVYKLATTSGNTTLAAINWANYPKPVATIVMSQLDVPTRDFTLGFPGNADLQEWFAIRFSGTLTIPAAGNYTFEVSADDGALVYIDEVLVVNDDGVHSTTTKAGPLVTITAGVHKIRVDYFQGPATSIALQLLWKGPKDSAFSVIDKSYLGRPTP